MRLSDAAHARSLPQQLGCALLNGCVSWVAAQTHFSAPRLSHTHMGSVLHTRGSFSTRWRAQGTRNPARSGSAQPERTLLLKHTHAHAQSSSQKAMCPLPWETCGDTACYLLISPERQPPRTWTASGRGEVGLVQLGKAHQEHAKRHFCPLHFLSAVPPLLAVSFLLPEQGPGLSPSSEDERQLDLGP